jgi:hypothetical protein
MPKSPRHGIRAKRMARQAATLAPRVDARKARLAILHGRTANTSAIPTELYKITSTTVKVDLRKQFAGLPIVQRGAERFVKMTPAQARYWIDQGVIEAFTPPTAAPAPAEAKAPSPVKEAVR